MMLMFKYLRTSRWGLIRVRPGEKKKSPLMGLYEGETST